MAKPQLELGRVEIALDLFVAIMTADFSNREMIVLSEAILQSYGPKKRRNVELIPASIEVYSGLRRDNALRALRSLMDRNVISENPGGTYRFNKDYESWIFPPEGLAFRNRLIRFANSAFERFQHLIDISRKGLLPLEENPPKIGVSLLQREENPPKTGGKLLQREEANTNMSSNGSRTSAYSFSPLNGVSQGIGATSGNAQVSPPDLKTLELNSIQHQHPPTPLEGGDAGGGATSNPRNPDDAADIASAVGVLKASPTTRDLADELARKHDRNGNLRSIEGWRFLVAAGELRRAKAGAVGMGLLVTKAREASRADLGALVAPRRPAEVLPEVLRADPNSPAVLANARLKARALKDERNPI